MVVGEFVTQVWKGAKLVEVRGRGAGSLCEEIYIVSRTGDISQYPERRARDIITVVKAGGIINAIEKVLSEYPNLREFYLIAGSGQIYYIEIVGEVKF